jgi:dipeptide/tripeptide permease
MTDQSHHVTEPDVTPVLKPPPTNARLVRDQRKTILVAAVLMVACYWVMGQLGQWTTATLTAIGILLALVNHLVTEFWLARVIASGRQPTREKMIVSTLVRLLVLASVAVGLAVAYWPSGIGLLLGLALFRLIALVMTGIPLLKELKSQ